MWSEKHRPGSVSGMVGNEEARATLVGWLAKWKKGTRPILLVGPPGTGKTTVANLVAPQFGYDMIGLNASDVRSKSKISEILEPVLGNVGILGSPLIFIDEVDGIHGRSDFGGAEALIKILKNPVVPIILAANSDASNKMRGIKKAVTTVYFKKLSPRLLRVYLRGILKKENAELGPGSIIQVINRSGGDIRSMMNLAQSLETGFTPDTGKSHGTLNVEAGVAAFFKAESVEEARRILYSIGSDPREKINAFYSSIVMAGIGPEARSTMLQAISEADMLYGRIIRTQQWRLLRYLNEILLRVYLPGTNIGYAKYNLSWPVLNRIIWDGKKLRSVSGILAEAMHTSRSTIATLCLPYMLHMMKGGHLDLGLDESHESALRKEMARA